MRSSSPPQPPSGGLISSHCPYNRHTLIKPKGDSAAEVRTARSPDIVGNQIDLVVVVETWRNKLGAEKEGMSSSYLSRLRELAPAEGRMVTANVVTSTALKITDYTKPCVMIGLGTGIAPFRSFIQKYFYEREKNGIRTGEVVLYFGARTSADEYLYGHELEQYKLWGTVSVCSFPTPVSQWRPYSITRPIQPPHDSHSFWSCAAEERTARRRCGWRSRATRGRRKPTCRTC